MLYIILRILCYYFSLFDWNWNFMLFFHNKIDKKLKIYKAQLSWINMSNFFNFLLGSYFFKTLFDTIESKSFKLGLQPIYFVLLILINSVRFQFLYKIFCHKKNERKTNIKSQYDNKYMYKITIFNKINKK